MCCVSPRQRAHEIRIQARLTVHAVEIQAEQLRVLAIAHHAPADGSGLTLPGDVLPHVTVPDRIDAMSVVSFRTSRHMVFVVGDVPQADLAKLADAVAGPLYRGLMGV